MNWYFCQCNWYQRQEVKQFWSSSHWCVKHNQEWSILWHERLSHPGSRFLSCEALKIPFRLKNMNPQMKLPHLTFWIIIDYYILTYEIAWFLLSSVKDIFFLTCGDSVVSIFIYAIYPCLLPLEVLFFTFCPLSCIIPDGIHKNCKVLFPVYGLRLTIFRPFGEHIL